MQDRYVGDVGDFAKFALLRQLAGVQGAATTSVRLGIVWCRFPNESHNEDGRHITYLRRAEYEHLDDELLTELRKIVASGRREITAIGSSGIMPKGTVFCGAQICPERNLRMSPLQRQRHRDHWLSECLGATNSCNLVFFDPDNGIEASSVPKAHQNAGKYIYWDELEAFWQRGTSLLVYHHLNRTMPAARQVEQLAKTFRTKLDGSALPIPLVFRRGSSRVFWLLLHHGCPVGLHLRQIAHGLLHGGWSQHFRPFGWPSSIIQPQV